ncbi:hypothetical protein H2O64_16630 [Kordia sp. YSTF-M3]|uniref:Uncharacterized protein n=1 Tax=Kordia aestuariivivens TaxID=2759037 RepID=A0ABR7QCK6_9FLAO|nr:hypothetical protein [Kordia aestuariivivens]MBC8756302.1 hypothetical protein [Kordia aestuariivivens]
MVDMTPTNSFIRTLTQTPKLATELSQNFTRLKNTNDEVIKYLGYPQIISDDLNKLYKALSLTKDLLTIVSVVPEVGQAASAYKTLVNTMMLEIKPAKDAAARLAKTVKPLHDNLQKLDPILDKGIAAANEVAKISGAFLTHFTEIASCINSLPEGSVKETGQNYLNTFSSKTEPGTVKLNKAMSDTNSVINTLYNELAKIKAALNPLPAILNAINDVFKVLNPLMDILKEVEHALKTIEIMIPLPYPHMVSLYDIFNTLGEFLDLAMKPIEGLINDLLNALHIKLPSIPGLSDLINIHINLPSIPNFDALIAEILNVLKQFEIDIKLFDLSCPPK